MENRRQNRRFPATTRLLTILFLITTVLPVFSDSSLPGAVVRIIPETDIQTGQVVTIELSVPEVPLHELQLEVPSLSSAFTLVGGRRDRRVQKTGITESVIVLEYRAERSGLFFIGPFVISSNHGDAVLPAVRLQVLDIQDSMSASLRWYLAGTEMRTGQPQIVQLQLKNAQTLLGFDVSVPEGSILELSGTKPDPDSSAEYSVVAEYLWTVLYPGRIRLPSAVATVLDRSGQQVTVNSAVRSVQVTGTVSASASTENSGQTNRHHSDALLLGAFKPLETADRDFPSLPAVLADYPDFIPHWNPQEVHRVLAGFRALEYQSLRPLPYRSVREELESVMELPSTHPVSRGYWRSVLLLIAIAILSAALILYLFSLYRSFLRSFAHLFLVIGIFIAGYVVILYIEAASPVATVAATKVYTIPDTNGNTVEQLAGGQTVMVRKRAGDWLLVRTHTGREGWITLQTAVFYGEDNEFW